MADIKWIKITTDIFDNRKIRQIESMPDGDTIIVIWLKLLILAGDVNDSGLVYFTRDIPYTDQLLSTQFNRPLNTIQLALRTFQQFGMIDVVDDVICVSNWEKYQNIEAMDKIREQTRKRVAKHRELKRLEDSNAKCNVTVTQCNATEIDIEKDIEKDIDKKIIPPTPLMDVEMSEPLKAKLQEWLQYKKERRDKYTDTGMKSLLSQVKNAEKKYGTYAVVEAIDYAMSNGWKGMNLDRLKNQKPAMQSGGFSPTEYLQRVARGEA